ncbi:uncharacterized protein LOC128929568 [Callithrix jacchus]|uniref:uncharacterized protein LOC128929568 n=1 Tax=Callithrix jacchus TaxID=9483 RepID=UPI0023DD305C|nr:uncharacterized protein LOC128929568 [Callithrix jacchus]
MLCAGRRGGGEPTARVSARAETLTQSERFPTSLAAAGTRGRGGRRIGAMLSWKNRLSECDLGLLQRRHTATDDGVARLPRATSPSSLGYHCPHHIIIVKDGLLLSQGAALGRISEGCSGTQRVEGFPPAHSHLEKIKWHTSPHRGFCVLCNTLTLEFLKLPFCPKSARTWFSGGGVRMMQMEVEASFPGGFYSPP